MATKTSQKINLLRNKAKELTTDVKQMAEIDTLAEAAQDEYYEVRKENERLRGELGLYQQREKEYDRMIDQISAENGKAQTEISELKTNITDINSDKIRLAVLLKSIVISYNKCRWENFNSSIRVAEKEIQKYKEEIKAQTPGHVGEVKSE